METHPNILVWRIPLIEELAGYSPLGHKESDMAEATEHIAYSLYHTAEINTHCKATTFQLKYNKQ